MRVFDQNILFESNLIGGNRIERVVFIEGEYFDGSIATFMSFIIDEDGERYVLLIFSSFRVEFLDLRRDELNDRSLLEAFKLGKFWENSVDCSACVCKCDSDVILSIILRLVTCQESSGTLEVLYINNFGLDINIFEVGGDRNNFGELDIRDGFVLVGWDVG